MKRIQKIRTLVGNVLLFAGIVGISCTPKPLPQLSTPIFPENRSDDWTRDGVRLSVEDGKGPDGRSSLRVECDFSQKKTATWSREIPVGLIRPGEHGALELWIDSEDLLSLEVGLTQEQDGREKFYSCVVPVQPGQGWSKMVVPFEELRSGTDSVAADPSGFSRLRIVAHRPDKNTSIGDGNRSGTVQLAGFAFVACAPREAQSFPEEVQKKQVDDVVLSAWNSALEIRNMPWDAIIGLGNSDPEFARQFESWRTEVGKWAVEPIIKRPVTWDEVVAAGWVEPRAHRMDPPQRDRFAVALASGKPWHILGRRLPLAALVARQSGDPVVIDYLNRQLAECATWFPLQMQGWTLNPPPGGDGPWLTECYAMVPLALAMNIAGERIDPEVRESVRALVQKTVDWIDQAWREQIPWYVKSRAYESNQWALPAAALTLGCLVLGEEKNRAAYELGMRSLAQHLHAQGKSGSFAEGYSYASMTMDYVMPVIWMLDRSGDRRLSEIPFMRKFSAWHHQMNLPGKMVINHSDSGSVNKYSALPRFLMLSALVSGDPSVLWGNEQFYSKLNSEDVFGSIYQAELEKWPKDRPELPRHAWFADQQLAVWRSGWGDDDVAVWVKGGTLNDFHHHSDQGHVSVINGKEILLLDPGMVNYGDPDYELMFKSCAGHNVLQTAAGRLGRGRRGRVPVTVDRMDSSGGSVEIDGSETEFEVRFWKRLIDWTGRGRVTVKDRATLFQPRTGGEEWFRWHIGSEGKPTIARDSDGVWKVVWGENTLTISADRALLVDVVVWRNDVLPGKKHYCVVVKAAESGDSLELTTTLAFTGPMKGPEITAQ